MACLLRSGCTKKNRTVYFKGKKILAIWSDVKAHNLSYYPSRAKLARSTFFSASSLTQHSTHTHTYQIYDRRSPLCSRFLYLKGQCTSKMPFVLRYMVEEAPLCSSRYLFIYLNFSQISAKVQMVWIATSTTIYINTMKQCIRPSRPWAVMKLP